MKKFLVQVFLILSIYSTAQEVVPIKAGGSGGSGSTNTYLDSDRFRIKSIANGDTVYTTKGLADSAAVWAAITALQGGSPTLSAPTLSAGTPTSSSIPWTWTTPANATGYVLQTSTDNSTWSTAYTGSATNYTSTGLTASTLYYGRVRATASGYNTSPYGTASGTTASEGGGGTELLVSPNDFSNAAWVKTRIDVTPNSVVGVSGGTTGDVMLPTAVNGRHFVGQTITKDATSKTYILKLQVANNSIGSIGFAAENAAGNGASAVFLPYNGSEYTTTQTYGSGFTAVSNNLVSLANGYKELTFVFTTDASTDLTIYLELVNGGSYTGDGVIRSHFDAVTLKENL